MNGEAVRGVLESVASGAVSVDDALTSLQAGPFRSEVMPFATPDFHRELRVGLCEVIYAPGKSADQLKQIARSLAQDGRPVLVTRLLPEQSDELRRAFPEARLNVTARTAIINAAQPSNSEARDSYVGIVAAGTSDAPVAEEAAETCSAMGIPFESVNDVGVAGLHRLVDRLPRLREASVLIVVAGMDGALPSVVGGLVATPVIGVPTSTGYGASFEGLSALLTMLCSCAPGVTVTNIDSGFSAAMAAAKIVNRMNRQRDARP
ncbi:MAG: nickel pincer cofactor biosynthesis protein LarB [Gemmatimonadales bacterium]